jgi:flagellar protein FlaG
MANDMSLTLNALPAKSSGKAVPRTSESQSVAALHDVNRIKGTQQVEDARQADKPSSSNLRIPKDELSGAVSQMKDFAQMLSRELQFDVDDDLGRTVVRVVDKDSGDLIRQIPSDEVLTLAKQMKEMREAEEGRLDGKGLREQPVGLLVKFQV